MYFGLGADTQVPDGPPGPHGRANGPLADHAAGVCATRAAKSSTHLRLSSGRYRRGASPNTARALRRLRATLLAHPAVMLTAARKASGRVSAARNRRKAVRAKSPWPSC